MKKLVRILGLSLVVGLVSCTPDDNGVDTTPEVTEASIKGEYTYNVVLVPVGVDTDNDGKTNTNLMNEKGKECVWDNVWVFTEKNVTLYDRGSKCDSDSPEILLTGSFVLDKNEATITIKNDKGEIIDVLKGVLLEFDDYSKQTYLSFSQFDKDPKINQDVRYVLKK